MGVIFALSGMCKSPTPTTTDNVTSKNEITTAAYQNSNILPIAHPYGGRIELLYDTNSHNPTFDEVLWFIHTDNTDKLPYIYGVRGCSEFAELLQHNATQAGIKCGYVSIDFKEQGGGHACNIFETTDNGLVYIDCTGSTDNSLNADNDKIVKKFGIDNVYAPSSFDYVDLKEYERLLNRIAPISHGYTDKARPMRLRGMSNSDYAKVVEEYNKTHVPVGEDEWNRLRNIESMWGTKHQWMSTSWIPLGTVSNYKIYWPSQSY